MKRHLRRFRLFLLTLRWVLLGGSLGACGSDLPSPKESGSAVTESVLCYARLHDEMRTEMDCASKRAKADLVAQTDPHCRAAGVDLSGLICGDGGTQ